jgi:hypothetical protein
VGIAYRVLTTAMPLVAGLGMTPAMAQDTGGVQLTFGIVQRLESTENLDLAVDSAGRTTQATTDLSFNLLTETRTQRLSFDAGAILRVVHGPGTNSTDIHFGDPRASLAYSRTSANAQLNLSAYANDADIAFLRILDDFRGPDGEIDLPEDLGDLSGTGTRRSYGAEAALRWGNTGPVGFGLSAKLAGIDYIDATAADLVDSRRITLGASLRLSVDAATELTFGLNRQTYDDATTSRRRTMGVDAGLARDLANGRVTADLSVENTADGTRSTLNFGRSLDLSRGALSAGLGIGHSAAGQTYLTADIALRHDLPDGQLTATLRRGFTTGTGDSEAVTTALSLDYSKEITSSSALSLGLTYIDSEDTASGLSTRNASLSASYTHALTPDWGLNVGYIHRLREEEPNGTARSGIVFMSLSRDFVVHY